MVEDTFVLSTKFRHRRHGRTRIMIMPDPSRSREGSVPYYVTLKNFSSVCLTVLLFVSLLLYENRYTRRYSVLMRVSKNILISDNFENFDRH